MIRYALVCNDGHEFEAWFASSGEYDRLRDAGHLSCAVCGSSAIGKQLMAPAVSGTLKRQPESAEAASAASQTAVLPVQNHPVAVLPDAQRREFLRQMRELKRKIVENAEDVGERFAEEARKIHYGESARRGIFGKTTIGEAAELIEEGVEVAPLPEFPDERN